MAMLHYWIQIFAISQYHGFYYGIGAGIKLEKWSFELTYDVTETKLSYEDDYYKIDNSKKNLEKFGVSAGYSFEF